jgi:microcystin-dependent protein
MSASSMNGYEGAPIPVGTVFPYAGTANPSRFPKGYLICNGASCLRTAFPELFRVLGTTYGPGAQPGLTFSIPNFNNRYLKSSAVAGTVTVRSGTGTFADITLDTANLPAIPGITFSCSLNGGYPEGSSASNTNPTQSGGAFPDSYPMSEWDVTQTVNFATPNPPTFNYSNGTGVVAPIPLATNPLAGFEVASLEITYIIKTDYTVF